MENGARDWCWLGEDITRRGVVLSALIARPVLSVREQQVQVIASDIVLCQVDNGHRQTLFTVVICRMLRDISNQLGDLRNDISVRDIGRVRVLP